MADIIGAEVVTELLLQLFVVSGKKAYACKGTAKKLATMIGDLLPTIYEIQHIGVKLSPHRQVQLSIFSETLEKCRKLTNKVMGCSRWNIVRVLYYAKKMEDLEKKISSFLRGPLMAHILADVHHLRATCEVRFNRVDMNLNSLNEQLATYEVHFNRIDMKFDRLRWSIRECCSGLRWFTLILSSGLLLVWFKI